MSALTRPPGPSRLVCGRQGWRRSGGRAAANVSAKGKQHDSDSRRTSSVNFAAVRTAPASFSPKPPLDFFLPSGASSDGEVELLEKVDSAMLSLSSTSVSGAGGGGGGASGC